MENLLLYLLKSAAILSIFYLVYTFLLKNDTSFQANRHFLFWGILAAAVLPSLEFTRIVYMDSLAPSGNFLIPSEAMQNSPLPTEETDWWQILGLVYFIGLAIMLLRFIFQLYSILKIIKNQPKKPEAGFNLISTNIELAPFSFFQTIVFNPNLHPPEELQLILEHEKVHARQWHSADVLLSHLITAVLWFNPLSWYYRKCIIQNLEFVADREAVATSASKTSYQHALVKIAVADFQPALANNFNQPLIKKRIMMLNKKPTQEKTLWKMGLSIPMILVFMFFFQVNTEAQILAQEGTETNFLMLEKKGTVTKSSSKKSGSGEIIPDVDKINATKSPTKITKIFPQDSVQPLIVIDGKVMDKTFDVNDIDPKDIAIFNVHKADKATEAYGGRAKNGVIEIRLKSEEGSSAEAKIARKEALYVVDGKVMDENFNSEDINPEDIALINVIKGDHAIAKYGDKAKNGVIEITTKD